MAYLGMCAWASLAQAIALLDGYLQSAVDGLDKLLSQRCSARVEHTKTAEIVFVHYGMFP